MSRVPRRRRLAARRPLAIAIALVALALLGPPVAGSEADAGARAWRAAARESDAVVTGTVRGLEGRWAGKKIQTTAELAVDRSVKGGAAATVRVAVMGGRVERPVPMTMIVADAPTLAENEEALFFLRDAGDGTFTVSRKLPVHRDPATGEKRLAVGHRTVPLDSIEKLKKAIERAPR